MLDKFKPSTGIAWLSTEQKISINEDIEKEYFLRLLQMKHLVTGTLEESRTYELPPRVLPFGSGETEVLIVLKGGMPVDFKTTVPFSDAPGYVIRHMLKAGGFKPLNHHYTVTVTDFAEDAKLSSDEILEYVAHRLVPMLGAMRPKVVIIFSELVLNALSELIGTHFGFRELTPYVFKPLDIDTQILGTYSPIYLLTKEADSYKSAIWADIRKAFLTL